MRAWRAEREHQVLSGADDPVKGVKRPVVYGDVVVFYMKQVGITGESMKPHALRAPAAKQVKPYCAQAKPSAQQKIVGAQHQRGEFERHVAYGSRQPLR